MQNIPCLRQEGFYVPLPHKPHLPARCQETASEYREGGTTKVMPPTRKEAKQRLEQYEEVLSRTVLWGGSGSNATSLPGK